MMASFKVVYGDGSVAKNMKVTISFDGGGQKTGFTDNYGNVTISGSNTYGSIFVKGVQVYKGNLNICEVRC